MNNNLLKTMMKERGFTQEKLAHRVGVDRSTLNRKLMNHRKGFCLKEACAVGRALQLTRAEMAEVFFSDFSA